MPPKPSTRKQPAKASAPRQAKPKPGAKPLPACLQPSAVVNPFGIVAPDCLFRFPRPAMGAAVLIAIGAAMVGDSDRLLSRAPHLFDAVAAGAADEASGDLRTVYREAMADAKLRARRLRWAHVVYSVLHEDQRSCAVARELMAAAAAAEIASEVGWLNESPMAAVGSALALAKLM